MRRAWSPLAVIALVVVACGSDEDVKCDPLPVDRKDGCLGTPSESHPSSSDPRYPVGCEVDEPKQKFVCGVANADGDDFYEWEARGQ